MPTCWRSSRRSFFDKKERWPRLFGRRFFFAGGVAEDCDAGWDVVGDYGAGSNDSVVADSDAGQEDGSAADPDVAADADGLAGFEVGAAGLGIAGMVGGVDLDGWADLGAVADLDGVDVEQDAVEVEEDAAAEVDVVAVVAEEGWADGGVFAEGAENFGEERRVRGGVVGRGVVFVQERDGVEAFGYESRVFGVVEVAGEHLLFFGISVGLRFLGRHRCLLL